MTSKKSSGSPLKFTFRQGFRSLTVFIAVALCGVIAFCTTLYTVSELFGTEPVFDDNGNVTEYIASKDSYHFLIFRDAEYMSTMLILGVAVCGILAAICLFNFITSKKMVNVYYSLGITRTKLFCGKYLSGLLMLFVASVLPMAVTFFANIFTVGYSASLFRATLFYFLYLFTVAVTSFTLTSAVFAVVGTTFETAVFSVVLLLVPDVFLFSIQALMDKFLYGNPYGISFNYMNSIDYYSSDTVATLSGRFGLLSPLFWGKEQMIKFALCKKEKAGDPVPAVSPEFFTAILWIVLTVGIFFLAVFFFNRRKAEICGFIGTNRVLNTTVSVLAAFAAYCYAMYIAGDMIMGMIIGALAFTAVHLILEAVVLRDGKKFLRGLYKLPIGIAVCVGLTFIFNGGLFGFSQRVPDIEDIESVAVTSVGSTTEYGLFTDTWHYGNYDLRYYSYGRTLTGEFTSENDIKAVLDVHKSVTEALEEERTLDNNLQFVYTLKNGTKLRRSFEGISPETYKKALYLEDCDYYNETLREFFTGTIRTFNRYDQSPETVFADAQKNVRKNYYVDFYSSYADQVFNLRLSEKDRIALLDALYKDLTARTAQQKYYPEAQVAGFVMFGYGDEALTADTAPEKTEITENAFSARYSEFLYSNPWSPYFSTHITEDMTNTVTLLKEIGIYDKMTAAPEFVSAEVIPADEVYEIAFGEDEYLLSGISRCFVATYSASGPTISQEGDYVRYEETIGLNANMSVYTDKNVIADLVKNARTVYEQDELDKGYFVSFKTAEGDTALSFIPDGKLPESIKQ